MPSLSNPVKAVFFDLGWTLVYPPSGDWEFTEPAKKLFRWDVYATLPEERRAQGRKAAYDTFRPRHGWPNRSWHIPALMGISSLLLAFCLVLGVMELGTGDSAASAQEAALLESAQEEESETEAGVSQAALREEAALSEASSAVESAPEESYQEAMDFAVSYYEEPQPITEEEAAATLESLRDTFPEGAYWNHVGVEDWDEFTVTDSPCQHDLYWDAYCNTYTGGIQELFPQFEPMEQCLGFAALLSDLVFGEDAPVSAFTDYTQLRVGDNIRLELTEHSMVVLTVDGEGITVVECNSDYEHCRISWDRFLSWDDLAATSYEMECITRYEE